MPAPLNLVGQKINRLTVVRRIENPKDKQTMFECLCDCGNTVAVRGNALATGHTKSCGCLRTEQMIKHNHKHGGYYTRMYTIWGNMKSRCNNPRAVNYAAYGGRGVRVCEEWKNSFENFQIWALSSGYEETLTLDRIDVNGDYCPENCRWITHKEQQSNKRNNRMLTYNGETHTAAEWARKLNMDYLLLHNRITRLGWSAEKALTTPARRKK